MNDAERLIEVYPDIPALTSAAAETVTAVARKAVDERGRFLLALSGGKTPRPLYQELADQSEKSKFPWEHTLIFWSDERFVPLDNVESNAGAAMELLLKKVPIPSRQIFPMYLENTPLGAAAAQYEAILEHVFGNDEPRLDLVLLGCGEDGHTASLFPNSPAVAEQRTLVIPVDPGNSGIPRVTMSLPLLNRTREVIFIVTGQSKSDVVDQILSGSEVSASLPASLVAPPDGMVRWMLDQGAARSLDR